MPPTPTAAADLERKDSLQSVLLGLARLQTVDRVNKQDLAEVAKVLEDKFTTPLKPAGSAGSSPSMRTPTSPAQPLKEGSSTSSSQTRVQTNTTSLARMAQTSRTSLAQATARRTSVARMA